MTNEELAAAIKVGDTGLIPILWQQVVPFISQQARIFYAKHHDFIRTICDIEDICQAGFFALLSAIDTYDPDEAGFLTWLNQHLKNDFAEAAQIRSERQKQQSAAEAAALSLNAPFSVDGDDNDVFISDVLPDRTVNIEDEITDSVFTELLHQKLVEYLDSTLSPEAAALVSAKYFEEKTVAELAADLDEKPSSVQKRLKSSLRKLHHGLRYTSAGAALERYIDEAVPIKRVALKRFQSTHVSEVEQAVFKREAMRNMLKHQLSDTFELLEKP